MQALGDPVPCHTQGKWDANCFACHKDEPSLFCTNCIRSFHTSPSCSRAKKMSAEDISSWRCPECISIDDDERLLRERGISTAYVNDILKYVSHSLLNDEYLSAAFMEIDYSRAVKPVLNPLDLTKIADKVDNNEYHCFASFWSDIKWIEHNFKIHHSGFAVEATKWLIQYTKGEIDSIHLCHECFWNANQMNLKDTWFTKPCSVPHLLVWAKQKGYPHWPAKLMASTKNTVDVQFCGDHKRTKLTPKDCLMYSKECPSVNIGDHKEKFDRALEEAQLYINNVVMKFGSFTYPDKPNTPFYGDKLERHLYDTINPAWKRLDSKIPPPIPTNRRRKGEAKVDPSARVRISSVVHIKPDHYDDDDRVSEKAITHPKKASQVSHSGGIHEFKGVMKPKCVERSKKRKMDGAPKGSQRSTVTSASLGEDRVMPQVLSNSTSIPKISHVQENVVPKTLPIARARKTFPNSMPFRIIPRVIIETLPTVQSMPKSLTLKDKPVEWKIENDSDNEMIVCKAIGSHTIPSNPSFVHEHSSGMLVVCNTMVENQTQNMADCIRSSLPSTLLTWPSRVRLPKRMVSPNETTKMKVQECEISVDNMCEEPDLPINLTDSVTSSKTSTRTSDKFFKQPKDNSVFEVPDVPPKAKKRSLNMPSLDEPGIKISCQSEHSPEILALCNRVVEKNLQKMSTVVRSSLSNTLFDFVETSKPDKQVRDLQEQMEQQKRYYDQLIDGLQSNLNTASTENSFLSTTITKMQKTNIELTNRLKNVEAENEQLHSVNVNLTDGNTKLATNISKLTMENRNLVKKVIEAEKKCDSVEKEAWDQCAKLITNTKQQQWCANCGTPGGRYYCSAECDKNIWFPGRL